MNMFLCLLFLSGFQAHAATLNDVNRLVELLNRQLEEQRPNNPGRPVDPERVLPIVSIPELPSIPGITGMPPGITGMPVITQMPVMPEPGIPGRDYGTTGHERCTYINDLFEEMYRIPVGEEMIDRITYDPKYTNMLVTALERFRDIDDREGVVYLTMRRFIKMFLADRLRCPAAVFERYIMVYMKREEGMLLREKDSMFSKLIPVLANIPHIQGYNITHEILARSISKETHGRIFNETMEGILSWSMTDVTSLAEQLRYFVRAHYQELMNMIPESLPTVIEPFIKNTIYWDYCPSLDEVVWRHKNAFSELRYGLMSLETEYLCFYEVAGFIERYVPEPTLHGNDETTYRNVLTDTCDIVGDYIKELVGRLEWLEMSIEDKEPTEFVEIIRPYFDEAEMKLLMRVLEKIGWRLTQTGNHDLTVADVIAHEEKDVEHWTNLVRSLTQEMFNAMTFEEFVEIVDNWLSEKHARIDKYKEYQGLEPVY